MATLSGERTQSKGSCEGTSIDEVVCYLASRSQELNSRAWYRLGEQSDNLARFAEIVRMWRGESGRLSMKLASARDCLNQY
mmetsp:Transcript_3214/g.7167  ORF Transcript_3214/g.7167 Transcript_3214/m.7167 type:complete len:81 (-) Transcript_3214:1188-1430(-)